MVLHACCVLVVAVAAVDQAGAELRVWTVPGTSRVLRSAPAGSNLAVKLAAARNEWESFQVLLRSDSAVKAVRIEPGDLKGPGGAVLTAETARLFRQHLMHVEVGTYRHKPFTPDWYPDGLIPARHPLTGAALHGGRLAAEPFDLPAEQTHGFWVDLYVPAGAKPGRYAGTYRLRAEGRPAVEVPVELTVWDFELPATPTLKTSFGSPAGRMRSYYARRAKDGKEPDVADWPAVETQCAELLARHRLNATPPSGTLNPVEQKDGTFRIPPERVRQLAEFIDRYHVNALMTPHPRSAVSDPDKQRDRLRAWLSAFDRAAAELKRPGVVFYTYLKDEPNDKAAYEYVQKWGRAVREAKSVVKVLVVEQTWTQDAAWGDLYGAVDVWCPLFSLFKPDSAASRQALGETVWTYTALCQLDKTPWWHIDWPLQNYRVPAWIAWRYRIRGLLYWGWLSYWNQVDDPWTDPKTYCPGSGTNKLVFNGEGTLVYPGRAAGYDGIAPSLRLKALRDGIEDYEYLAILERQGQSSAAEKIVLPVAASWFQWSDDPAAWSAARTQLAELILAGPK